MIKYTISIIIIVLISDFAVCQINGNKKNLQLKDNINKYNNKNEIEISGYLPKNRSFRYSTYYGESNDIGKGLDSLKNVKIQTTHSIFVYSYAENGFPPLYLEIFPGEDINIAIDKENEIKISSKYNNSRSKELSFYYRNYLFSMKNDISMVLVRNKSLEQFKEYADSLESARKIYLSNFEISNHISNNFISIISKQIQDKKYYSLVNYLLQSKDCDLKLLSTLIEKLKRFYFSNDTHYSVEYRMGIHDFCRYLTIKELKVKDTPENLFKTARKYFKGKSLDAALFTFIKQTMNQNASSTQNHLAEFYSRCKDKDFIEYVKSEESKYILALDKSIIDGVITLDKEKSSWSQILDKFKGKVIYVDFWASWCMPCINEIPYLEKLKSLYYNKDVIFVSISIDLQYSNWKGRVDQLKIDNPYSFLLVNTNNSPLLKSLDVTTIPHFVLYDKTGKVAVKDAPKPSEKKIISLIDLYL